MFSESGAVRGNSAILGFLLRPGRVSLGSLGRPLFSDHTPMTHLLATRTPVCRRLLTVLALVGTAASCRATPVIAPAPDPSPFVGCWRIDMPDEALQHPLSGALLSAGITNQLYLSHERAAADGVDLQGNRVRAYRVIELAPVTAPAREAHWFPQRDGIAIDWTPADQPRNRRFYSLVGHGDTLRGSLSERGSHIGIVLSSSIIASRMYPCPARES
jgi:hypothetical protein